MGAGAFIASYFTKEVGAKLLSGLLTLLPYMAIAGAALYVLHLHSEAAISGMKLQQAEQVAKANADAVSELKAAKDRSDQVVADMAKDAETRSHTFMELRKDILSAKDTKGCASSPPMRALFNGLRQRGPAIGADKGGAH